MATASNQPYQKTLQWSTSNTSTSGNTIQITNTTYSGTGGFNPPQPSGPSNNGRSSSDICGHNTADGSRCQLDPSFDDDKCHWHTSEQCYRLTNDDTPCELPGSQPDGACHIHTLGCNESLTHSGVQKAVFHSIKGAYRWLGLHSDMRKGTMSIKPEAAARIAAEAGRAYLLCEDYSYDRERSLKDIGKKHSGDKGAIGKLINWFKSGFESPEDFDPQEGPLSVEELKKAIKRAWKKIDNGNHKAGARVAVSAGEAFLGEKLEVK